MNCVRICGSDVHYLLHGRIAHFIVEKPMLLGHEASGMVECVGKKVKTLKRGDRVAIEPGYGCRMCSYCKDGKYNLCPDMIFCATPPIDGNLSRYYCHPADFCFKLPDHVSFEKGAMLEPLSVGVHACRGSKIMVGDHVLILGAGPIGLVTLLAAKAMGASKIIVTDIIGVKLKKALELGATHVIDTKDVKENVVDYIKKLLDGQLPNKTIDCVGAESTIRLGIEATRPAGVLCIVGLAESEVTITISTALIKEVEMRGICRYCNDYPIALDMIASGKVDVKPMITHHYKLEETLEAFKMAQTNCSIKVIIHCDPSYQN